ncbi:Cytochrome P450 [Pleurostoma richardsiae]|uniref:Cytochrome P450 n=1 Tax=Pleurostoma richardsiae TaxID=41990 RepID=A0AA38R371_9PEZI|nr:Cytochrome P450 [Pleurostoma richardsiae]
MFTTFQGFSPKRSSESVEDSANGSRPKPKRTQVQRACNACRMNRVKCDTERPCRNCKDHKRRCVDGPIEIRSLAAATEEIDRLRARVRELEEQSSPSPSQHGSAAAERAPSCEWKGIRIDDLYHGPSSLPYFLHRMYAFLHPVLHPTSLDFVSIPALPSTNTTDAPGGGLARPQQDSYLDLYWLWYHPIYPILAEADFREHYESLWTKSTSIRFPSALVDIMLALCIQFSSSYTSSPDEETPQVDRSLTGFAYYRSCHSILAATQDRPSLVNVQCYMLSAIYLVNAGLVNHAQVMVAQAIRTATILGYNHEVLCHDPEHHQELSRRVWWTLYILDTQISIDVGRSFMIGSSAATCRRPSDSPTMALSLGAGYSQTDFDVTWLAFQNQYLSLTETIRTIHESFYAKSNTLISELDAQDIYANGPLREECANHLIEQMKQINTWVAQVPLALQIPRQSAKPFCTNRSPYILDQTIPVWLQRQRIVLELQYHHLCTTLYRSFICFYPNPAFGTPLSDSNAISALKHAIASTMLLQQTLTETDLLTGWHQAFYWQKSAAMVILGFACAYPVCPPTPSAKRVARVALEILEMLAENFDAAKEEVSSVQDLLAAAEKILARFRAHLQAAAPGSVPPSLVEESDRAATESSKTATPNDTPPSYGEEMGTGLVAESLWLNLESGGAGESWDWSSSDATLLLNLDAAE